MRFFTCFIVASLLTFACLAQGGEGKTGLGEDVVFQTDDGVEIHGTFYRAPAPGAPAVILLHMLGRTRADWNPLARSLRSEGINVLAIDLRGHGQSIRQDGREIGFRNFTAAQFNEMILDVKAARAFLEERGGIDSGRLGLIGASIGCNVAIGEIRERGRIRTAVLLSPGLDYKGVRTLEPIKAVSGCSFLIVASQDDAYSAKSSGELAAAATGKKRLHLYQNAGHGTRMFKKESGLETMILQWMRENLF